jgi:tRNA(Ile)-lysidine synthase
MRLRRVEPILRRALRGPSAPPRTARGTRAPLILAVSGGADSTALLIGLHNLTRELGLELHVAHLHHGLRGAAADADLAFVRALCARLSVPLTAARWDTRSRMRRRGLSGQAGLRTLRREFLSAAARRAAAPAIVTAHTADDQLETLLMRLGRGTGLRGLAGMRPAVAGHDRGSGMILWLKPLLGATRAGIEADLLRAGQPWREDRSNHDPHYTRSRVRHEAVPALARALLPGLEPSRARALLARRAAQAAAGARSGARALEDLAGRVLQRTGRIQVGVVTLERRRLAALPGGLRCAVLGRLWRRIGPRSTGLTRRHLAALDGLIDSTRGGGIIQLPGGWSAERDRDLVRFRCGAPERRTARARLRLPGRLYWDGARFAAHWTTGVVARRRMGTAPGTGEFFAAEGLDGPLVVRRAQADERFVPFGRTRAAHLGRFLSKQGVSNEVRKHPTVLADTGGILWVVGVRRSARAPVTAGTRRALWVHAERHD